MPKYSIQYWLGVSGTLVSLARVEEVRPQPVRYLNRLSDLLFVLSRVLARADGHGEVTWKHERRKARPQT